MPDKNLKPKLHFQTKSPGVILATVQLTDRYVRYNNVDWCILHRVHIGVISNDQKPWAVIAGSILPNLEKGQPPTNVFKELAGKVFSDYKHAKTAVLTVWETQQNKETL